MSSIIRRLIHLKILMTKRTKGKSIAARSREDQIDLFDFAINRFLMKLFKTNNILIVNECRDQFGIDFPSFSINARTSRFMSKIKCSDNILLNIFCQPLYETTLHFAYVFSFFSICAYVVFLPFMVNKVSYRPIIHSMHGEMIFSVI